MKFRLRYKDAKTTCIINCLVFVYSENSDGFSSVSFSFTNLVTSQRNTPAHRAGEAYHKQHVDYQKAQTTCVLNNQSQQV